MPPNRCSNWLVGRAVGQVDCALTEDQVMVFGLSAPKEAGDCALGVTCHVVSLTPFGCSKDALTHRHMHIYGDSRLCAICILALSCQVIELTLLTS